MLLTLVLPGLLAAASTLLLLRFGLLPRARRLGGRWVVPDRYKPGAPTLPGNGGLPLLAGWLAAIALWAVLYERSDASLSLLLLVSLLAFAMGFADDLLFSGRRRPGLSQPAKALLPLLVALPLAAYLAVHDELWPAWAGSLPPLLVLLGAACYLSLGTNLTNMHAGFNGLSAGNALIMLAALAVVAGASLQAPLLALAGATAALLWLNRYPARVIEGDGANHLWGAVLAAGLLLSGLWLPGLVLFAPQLLDFALWSYARLRGYHFHKYAEVVEGKLRPADPYKLKFLAARYFPREWQATIALWALQGLAALAFLGLVSL